MDVIQAMISSIIALLKWSTHLVLHGSWWTLKATFRFILNQRTTTFGSARWAKKREIEKAGAFKNKGDGVIVGKYSGKHIYFNGEGATLVYAPMGSGKGAGIIIPNLLTYKGSVFVTDPKGENYARTKRRRHSLTNAPVYALNLQDIERSDCFNPLDMIRTASGDAFDDAMVLADLLVQHDPNEAGHWAEKAQQKLAAMMLHICQQYQQNKPNLCTLSTIRRECHSGRPRLIAFLEEMTQSKNSRVREEAHDFLSTLGASGDAQSSGDEGTSILSKISAATGIWSRDTGPGQISQHSDFNLLDVIDQNASVFVIIPEEKLTTMKPFLRVMLGLSLHAVTRHHKERPLPKYKPLFVFDECAALGHMSTLENGMGYLRAYAKAILVFQDLDQIKQTYRKAKSIMNACACHVAFAVNDLDTAQELANRMGQKTVKTRNVGHSQSNEELLKRQHQSGMGEAGYHLLDPAEIMRLGAKDALVFLGPQLGWPIKAKRIEYWKEWRWVGLHDPWEQVLKFDANSDAPHDGVDQVPNVALALDTLTDSADVDLVGDPDNSASST